LTVDLNNFLADTEDRKNKEKRHADGWCTKPTQAVRTHSIRFAAVVRRLIERWGGGKERKKWGGK
jgi:hypothetical protein